MTELTIEPAPTVPAVAGSPVAVPRTRLAFAAGNDLPGWFTSALYAALVWCAAAGTIALLLLWRDWYRASTCSLLATAVTAAAWAFRPRPPDAAGAAHGPAIAACVIALVLLSFAGAAHSEHLFTDRDPAVYINTGRSIARTHLVNPKIAPGPFDNRDAFSPNSAGFSISYQHLHPNFLNFLPALLALGWSVGGDTGLLLVPALLGALALLMVYALASTLLGPRWALLPPAILTLAPLQSWFARDAYTELPLQLLALGGLWLLIEAQRDGKLTAGAIAGAILGSMTFVRIDALALLIAIPSALIVIHLRATRFERSDRPRVRGVVWSFGAALSATAIGGLLLSDALSPGYLMALRGQLHELELVLAAGVIVALAIGRVHRVKRGIGRRLARNEMLFRSGAALAFAGALYAYVLRPIATKPVSPVAAAAQRGWLRALHAYYFLFSFRWFAWYLGIVTLVLAVIGFVVLARRALDADTPATVLLAAAVPVTIIYIARPSISPDHLWAMRRYLPMVLPAMTIAATATAVWATAAVAKWRPRWRTPVVVAFLAAMLIPPAIVGRPLVQAKMQGGALRAIHTLCRAAGTDGAIAVFPYGFLGAELPQTLRGFCGVPAAALRGNRPAPLATFAAQWSETGHQFYVATTAPKAVTNSVPDAVEVAHVVVADERDPERTATGPPRHFEARPMEVWLYRVDPA